jgi:hypothetical protein
VNTTLEILTENMSNEVLRMIFTINYQNIKN